MNMYEPEKAEIFEYEIKHRGGLSRTIHTSKREIVELIEKSECESCGQIMDVKVDRNNTSVAILRCPKCKDQYVFPADVLWL
jgi:predicted Zn-ribbon and HTH transcriptional regulator